MIHSMAGGVLGDLGVHTFAKVDVGGAPLWYLAPMRVAAGQKVVVPYGREDGGLHRADRARSALPRAEHSPRSARRRGVKAIDISPLTE